MNAEYSLPKSFGYEKIVYVGGGIRVVASGDSVLAEYLPLPGDERDPIGDAERRTVSFSIPLSILGRPDARWRFAVIVGAQDDHGGAGIGEFRVVGRTASEWSGGGRNRSAGSNVYDVLLSP